MNIVSIHPDAYEANSYFFPFVTKGSIKPFIQKEKER
jgi:hypothetical protein